MVGGVFSVKMPGYERFDIDPPEDSIEEVDIITEPISFVEKKVPDFDHIEVEVSLEDNMVDYKEKSETINRASDFFLENNDNFRLSWQEVAEKIDKDLDMDPSRPPQPGCNKEYLRCFTKFITNISYNFPTPRQSIGAQHSPGLAYPV